MSDQPTHDTPNDDPNPATEPDASAPDGNKPPWGEDFDAEKAWNLVQNLRADKERLAKRDALTPEQKQKLAEFDRLEQASKTELEKAQEAAQKNAERAQAYLNSAVQAKIEALATGFADPTDAVSSLDAKAFVDVESGAIDSDAIRDALADLLNKKPHWAKAPETRTPAPNPAQGSSGGGSGDLTQLDGAWVKRMADSGRHEEIVKARQAGRLDQYLSTS